MTTVSEKYARRNGRPMFICDFSPPRGHDLATVEQVKQVGADFVCVAYSPGKSVRVDSIVMAYVIHRHGQQGVIFNLACRDMNKLALQNHLLGAQVLGLENVLVLKGDEFSEKDLTEVKDVSDYTTTGLIHAIRSLDQGLDFRGLKLRAATSFCAGATLDLGSDNLKGQVLLAHQKVKAGADFFVTQPLYRIEKATQFLDLYQTSTGQEFPKPVFWGLQILEKDGLVFDDVPETARRDLERGRPPVDMALEQLQAYLEKGIEAVYVVPPILRGGRRNYLAAQQLLDAFRR